MPVLPVQVIWVRPAETYIGQQPELLQAERASQPARKHGEINFQGLAPIDSVSSPLDIMVVRISFAWTTGGKKLGNRDSFPLRNLVWQSTFEKYTISLENVR